MSVGTGAALTALIPAAIGAATGIAKDVVGKQQEGKERKIAAEQMKWSPWTGMTPEKVQGAPLGAGAVQGLGAGLAFGQQANQTDADKDFREKYLNILGNQPQQSAQSAVTAWEPIAFNDKLKQGLKYFG